MTRTTRTSLGDDATDLEKADEDEVKSARTKRKAG